MIKMNLVKPVLYLCELAEGIKRFMTTDGYYCFQRAQKQDIPDIAVIADLYFTSGQWHNGIEGRINYFRDLFKTNNKTFYILRYYSAFRNAFQTVGYTSVIPEKPNVIDQHLIGTLNQYSIGINDIYKHNELIKPARYIFYVQAVAVLLDHRKSSKEIRDLMFATHLADIMRRYKDLHFSLIGEKFSLGGERFMLNRGFYDTEIESATKHKIFRFDSSKKKMPEKGKKLVRDTQRIRNQSKTSNCGLRK